MSKFLGYRKKCIIYKIRDFKCAGWVGGGGGGVYMDSSRYAKIIENEILFSFQHCTHFNLPSEFWISIHNDRYCLILSNNENEII